LIFFDGGSSLNQYAHLPGAHEQARRVGECSTQGHVCIHHWVVLAPGRRYPRWESVKPGTPFL